MSLDPIKKCNTFSFSCFTVHCSYCSTLVLFISSVHHRYCSPFGIFHHLSILVIFRSFVYLIVTDIFPYLLMVLFVFITIFFQLWNLVESFITLFFLSPELLKTLVVQCFLPLLLLIFPFSSCSFLWFWKFLKQNYYFEWLVESMSVLFFLKNGFYFFKMSFDVKSN